MNQMMTEKERKQTQPNILLIMPDQMRGDCLSIEDHHVLNTPVMDSIGKEGAYFSRAYTTCPSCIPARRSLLTGLYPKNSGMVGYREGLPITTPTLAQVLLNGGYATSLAGRYMHQFPKDEPYGFETQVLGSTYINDDDYAKYLEKKAPHLGGIKGIGISCNGREVKAWPDEDQLHPTTWAINQSRHILEKHQDERPLFHVSSYYAPHTPLFPPENYINDFLKEDLPPIAIGEWAEEPPEEVYKDNLDSERVKLEGEELRQIQAGYYGLIKHIDDKLDKLIEEFKEKSRSMSRPWVILLTSDHGDMLGDHHYFRKCEPYEGSSRIPFLIQASPEFGFSVGLNCHTPVCLEDIMPTLIELSGLEPLEGLDGKSLVPILRGNREKVREWLHGEHAPCYTDEQGFHLLTNGHWKYIWRPFTGVEQLFNLSEDPTELVNLAQNLNYLDVMEEVRERMIAELSSRSEGFVKDGKLVSGCSYPAIYKP
jgi:arylsulfatase